MEECGVMTTHHQTFKALAVGHRAARKVTAVQRAKYLWKRSPGFSESPPTAVLPGKSFTPSFTAANKISSTSFTDYLVPELSIRGSNN